MMRIPLANSMEVAVGERLSVGWCGDRHGEPGCDYPNGNGAGDPYFGRGSGYGGDASSGSGYWGGDGYGLGTEDGSGYLRGDGGNPKDTTPPYAFILVFLAD